MFYPIVDLHCDLLSYLAYKPSSTPYDGCARCSIPQLKQGGVFRQTLALFAETGSSSVKMGWSQFEKFVDLLREYGSDFRRVGKGTRLPGEGEPIAVQLAIENGSAFCSEEEPLSLGLDRLQLMHRGYGPLGYVSLTWNGENRFGGGALTHVGLKSDGKELLQVLASQGIPVDLSHACDRLAFDILDYIDGQGLTLRVLASHANFRSVVNVPRNLPDDLAREVFKRKGVVGLNFVSPFVGGDGLEHLAEHIEKGLELGGEDHLCFGADFFYEPGLPPLSKQKDQTKFFPTWSDASCYPRLYTLLSQRYEANFFAKLTHLNALSYFNPVFTRHGA